MELLDERKQIPVLLSQQLLELLATARVNRALVLGDGSGGGEGLVDLAVELLAVGDDEEGPDASQFAQDFLGEEDHREALAAALGMPENAEAALIRPDGADGFDGVVDAEILMVLGEDLDERAAALAIEDEVLGEVEQAGVVADAAQDGIERDDARLAFAFNLLPLEEVLPASGEGADTSLAAVGEEDEGVVPEELGDGVFIVAQVVLIGVLQAAMGRFEFDEDEGDAVDEADEIGTAAVHIARDPELRDEQEVVVGGGVPVDEADGLVALVAAGIAHPDDDVVFEQAVDLAVSGGGTHGGAVAGDLLDSQLQRVGGDAGVELRQRGAQMSDQDYLALGLAAKRAALAEGLAEGVDMWPAELFEQGDGGLLDEGVFAVVMHSALACLSIKTYVVFLIAV